MLIVSWKLEAKAMGYFSRDEWNRGMKKMNCDTIVKLKNQLGKLEAELDDPVTFKEIYKYAFDFAKEQGQKSLEVNTAQVMLALIMKKKNQHIQIILLNSFRKKLL